MKRRKVGKFLHLQRRRSLWHMPKAMIHPHTTMNGSGDSARSFRISFWIPQRFPFVTGIKYLRLQISKANLKWRHFAIHERKVFAMP